MMVDAQHNGAGTPIINNNTRKESKPARDFSPSLRGVGNLLNYHVGIFPSRDLSSSNLISDLLKTLSDIIGLFYDTIIMQCPDRRNNDEESRSNKCGLREGGTQRDVLDSRAHACI